MKRFTFLPRVILGLLLFVTGGGISLAKDVTNTVNGTTYTFKVTSTKDKTANVSLSQIGGTDLANYAGTDLNLKATYSSGTYTSGDTLYTITSMEAMRGNTTIKTVEMPSTVTSLPSYCFYGCIALTSFSFTDIKTITIGSFAFANCSSLTGITIPEGATVGERAFQCSGLEGELTIPSGTYNNRVFDGCTKVTDLFIHTGVNINDKWDGHGCFGSMPSVKNVTLIDDGDHTIPAYLFGCASFKDGVNLTIPESITAIGDYAFNKANFPTNLNLKQFTSFGAYAFANNKTLANKDVTFAENTKFTGEQTFLNCTALSGTLTIPNGANIPYKAFDGCSGIKTLIINTGTTDHATSFDGNAFSNMGSVTNVEIVNGGNNKIPDNTFKGAVFNAGVALNIDKDKAITAIGNYAFSSANFPKTLDLSQFTSYGASAFEDNTAFKGNDGDSIIAVKKPAGATSDVKVGGRAFWITRAKEIDIYPGVDYSGCGPSDAYYSNGAGPYNGKNIKTIKFTDGITSVPDYLFLHAKDIPSTCTVTWPTKPITHIGNGAFYGVQFTAAIPSEMSGDGTIGEYAYAHNNMSGEITIPTGCKDIGSHALYDCDNITKITVDSTTTSIGEFAFSDCAALASVELPTLKSGDPQLTLGGGFIANDPKLTAFTITNAVKTIYCCSNGNTNNASFSSLTTPFTVTLASDKVKAESENRTGGTFFTFDQDGTADNPNTLTIKVANGVTSIPDELFSENESGNLRQSFIDKIVLSGTDVKSIGTKSFYHIRALLSVDMSGAQNIANIGESAFADCDKLTNVTFGESSNITTVGASAFSGCSDLTSVDFGGAKKLQTLGESAFNNCSSLAKINQTDGKNDLRGSTLTSIGQYTFGGCFALANLYLPSTLMRIDAAAFTNGEGKVAKAASDDAAYIETSAGHCFNTFCRGFDVNVNKDMNTTVNTSNTATVWAVTGINTSARQAILQQVTESAPSSESYLNGYIIYNSVNDSTSATSGYKTSTDKLNLHLMFNNDSHNVIENASNTKNDNMMKGVIDAKTFSDADEASRCYVIWGKDQKLHHIKQNTTLAAGKAYIDPGTGGSRAKFDGFSFFFSSEPFTPTAINAVKANADSHSAAHDNDDSYYDLQGRKVEFPSTGIYIHHGRKVVITHKPQSLNL